jgi:hypothetical protein
MSTFDQDQIVKNVKDAAYATVGAGVLAFEQLEARRAELRSRLAAQVGAGRNHVDRLLAALHDGARRADARGEIVVERIEAALDDVQARLPAPVSDVVARARETGADVRHQVRAFILRDAA